MMRSLRTRILVLVTVPLVLLFGGVMAASWHRGLDNIRTAEQDRILAISTTLAPFLDGDALAQASRQYPEKDAISDWSEAPEPLRTLHHTLLRTASKNRLTTPTYVLIPKDSDWSFLQEHRDEVLSHAMFFGATSATLPYWHHEYEYRPLMGASSLRRQVGRRDQERILDGHEP